MALHILLLDADSARAARTRSALETLAEDVEITTVATGLELLRLATARPFDLAVAELLLPRPGLSGAATLRRLAEIAPGCRTLLACDHTGLTELLRGSADAVVRRRPRQDEREVARTAARLLASTSPEAQRVATVSEPRNLQGGIDRSDSSTTLTLPRLLIRRLLPGTLVAGKYRLIERIGRGGMGVVFRAEDTFIERPVAIKLVQLEKTGSREELEQRMLREVRIAGRLRHPAIVTVHDAGIEGGEVYLVMELIEGRTLRDRLREGMLPVEEALRIVGEILAALEHAHGEGVVHRDLKPSNVLLGKDGEVKVSDFGVAKLLALAAATVPHGAEAPAQTKTTSRELFGTVAYMAPEQMVGEEVDPSSDLYSLGAVLFEMLHGRPLASVGGPYARAAAHQAGRRPPALPTLSRARHLMPVLERALAVDRKERFTTSREFVQALERANRPGWQRFLPWLRSRAS